MAIRIPLGYLKSDNVAKRERIATPVCGLVRNDILLLRLLSKTISYLPVSGRKIGEMMVFIHNILWSAKKPDCFFTKFF